MDKSIENDYELQSLAYFNCPIRFCLMAGERWVTAIDVCAALGIGGDSPGISRIDPSDKMFFEFQVSGFGSEVYTLVNDAGLYSLVHFVVKNSPHVKAKDSTHTGSVAKKVIDNLSYVRCSEMPDDCKNVTKTRPGQQIIQAQEVQRAAGKILGFLAKKDNQSASRLRIKNALQKYPIGLIDEAVKHLLETKQITQSRMNIPEAENKKTLYFEDKQTIYAMVQ